MGAMLATLASGWAAFLVESQHLCSQSAAVASVADAGFWATYLAMGTWAMRTPRRALVAWPVAIAAAFGVAVLLRLLLLGGAQTCTI
jgi:hypothetical protein